MHATKNENQKIWREANKRKAKEYIKQRVKREYGIEEGSANSGSSSSCSHSNYNGNNNKNNRNESSESLASGNNT